MTSNQLFVFLFLGKFSTSDHLTKYPSRCNCRVCIKILLKKDIHAKKCPFFARAILWNQLQWINQFFASRVKFRYLSSEINLSFNWLSNLSVLKSLHNKSYILRRPEKFEKANGILLPKLFWPTVRKNCPSDREKLLKF